MNLSDTIIASATGNIVSALGVIRMSGNKSISIISQIFLPNNKGIFMDMVKENTLYYGTLIDKDKVLDEVIVSVFKSPHSFTGENVVEISHHGSLYIQQEILQLLICKGARLAEKGEFSFRAFLNGKMNLSQTEAIADLIASNNSSSHDLAIKQLRGDYNIELKRLRQRFLKIASLLELEIDFSAEQEVFIDRMELKVELDKAQQMLYRLVNSFKQGNAFKNGIPIAIAGKPNSGKSTLMNALLKDNRSIVSSMEGTTRDTIEETINVNGIMIRFIDTAGIRESDDEIEREGIKRSFDAMQKAQKILYLLDASKEDDESIKYQLKFLKQEMKSLNAIEDSIDKNLILVVNKDDISTLTQKVREQLSNNKAIFISAKQKKGIDKIINAITIDFSSEDISSKIFVTNVRHYQALVKALDNVEVAQECLINGESADIISENVRQATESIGQITGEITNEDVLTSIFSSFCIGK
ncbi:MAG: tRNA uridine-5-carboxymethylaminomethyl(34) synthesis GTPase MnmE [Bacteroidales bacterium]